MSSPDSEDKPEVAARVTWSGTGLDLRTGTPSERRIRGAVQKVMHNLAYRATRTDLRHEIAVRPDPAGTVVRALEGLTAPLSRTTRPRPAQL